VERRHVDYRRHDNRRYDHRRYDRHDRRHYSYRPVYPHHRHTRWVRGHRYHGPTYLVRDYGYYRLRPPPYGYHWVRADNDFLLVAITTGIILDLALR
jgi:Ni/Co efflux regulator RcnB